MIRDIKIEPILNGFIVSVGCQKLAYTSVDELMKDLDSYLREPEVTEKLILKDKGFNRKHTMTGVPPDEYCGEAPLADRARFVPPPPQDWCRGIFAIRGSVAGKG